jgi:hypothetical protein
LRHYLEVIADCPASSGGRLGLVNLRELSVLRVRQEAETKFFWKLTLNSGATSCLPIDPQDFFRVRPTHAGEPWLWKGPVAAIVGLPEGWVVDNEPGQGFQFSMYPLLTTREKAMRFGVFLYGNIVLKTPSEPTLEAIALRHERDALQEFPSAEFKWLGPIAGEAAGQGRSPQTLFRMGKVPILGGGSEYSLYADSPKGVLVLVLLCPPDQDDLYLPALRWIGGTVVMMTRLEGRAAESRMTLRRRAFPCAARP